MFIKISPCDMLAYYFEQRSPIYSAMMDKQATGNVKATVTLTDGEGSPRRSSNTQGRVMAPAPSSRSLCNKMMKKAMPTTYLDSLTICCVKAGTAEDLDKIKLLKVYTVLDPKLKSLPYQNKGTENLQQSHHSEHLFTTNDASLFFSLFVYCFCFPLANMAQNSFTEASGSSFFSPAGGHNGLI